MFVSRLVRAGFALALVAILALALMPSTEAPTVFASDKLNHMLAFFVLAAGGRVAWPKMHPAVLIALLAAYGGAIEILQWAMGLGREADWMDFVADVAAILVGAAAGEVFLRLVSRGSAPAEV